MSLASYAIWHYTQALKSGLILWGNFITFSLNFFSVPLLLRTYFSKFGRLGERYKKGLDLENLLSTFVINSVMRLVGMLIRTVVILLGLMFFVLVIISGAVLFIVWIFLPIVLFLTLVYGLSLLIL